MIGDAREVKIRGMRRHLVLLWIAILAGCAPAPVVQSSPDGLLGPSATPSGALVEATRGPAVEPGSSSGTGPATSLSPVIGLEPFPADWPAFPGFLDVPDEAPGLITLPEPTLTDPYEIGAGLYDPTAMAGAVVSLLDQMGVGIYRADGTPIRVGDEHDTDDLWLTDGEVRGLIEMGIADATAMGLDEGSPPFTFADLGAALEPLLPDWTTARLARAYDEAYAARPGDLIAGAMLGQPIEPGTPLTRTQLWFLFVDGFVTPSAATAVVPGALLASGSIPWGTGGHYLPTIPPLDPALSAAETGFLIGQLMLLGWSVPFEVQPLVSSGHEGHGGPGPTLTIAADIDWNNARQVVVSPYSHQPVAIPQFVPQQGGLVWWSSPSRAVLDEHGSMDPLIGIPGHIDGSGRSVLQYSVRQEPNDRHGPEVSETAAVEARMALIDLVEAVYQVPAQARGFVLGDRTVRGILDLSWHSREGIRLTLMNQYDLSLFGEGIDLAFGGTAHGVGTDAAAGFLEKGQDGIYRGTIFARSFGSFSGEWGGGTCNRLHDSAQDLYVVGRPISGGNLQLAFYPASKPWWWFPQNDCPDVGLAWQVGWEGGGPDNRPAGAYIPFGTGRWTTPIVGYSVWLPSEAQPEWVYMDDEDSSGFGLSVWYVRTELVDEDHP